MPVPPGPPAGAAPQLPPEKRTFVTIHANVELPCHKMELGLDGRVRVDGGPEHGAWYRLSPTLMHVRWHWHNDDARAKGHDYQLIPETNVWRAVIRECDYAHVLAERAEPWLLL